MIGIVIPTLGQRIEYLTQTIKSARFFGDVFIVLVTPSNSADQLSDIAGVECVIVEKEPGLASAINLGVNLMPEEIKYVGWIGDDDLLAIGSGKVSSAFLDDNVEYVMTFGMCRYINKNGSAIALNRSGQWAVPLLRFGPDLIPQPGSIYRRSTFNEIGQLDVRFGFAFDFDLFIRLSKAGRLKYLGIEVGSFRWHDDSKTVGARKLSVLEASRVRRIHLRRSIRFVSWIWEAPVIISSYLAGGVLNRRANLLAMGIDKT